MASLEQKISVLSQAMNLRTQRHQVLASNIANADTPNYKARDFSFEGAMRNAMSGNLTAGGVELARTSAGHMDGAGNGGPASLMYRADVQSAVDGNTVDMDCLDVELRSHHESFQCLPGFIQRHDSAVDAPEYRGFQPGKCRQRNFF